VFVADEHEAAAADVPRCGVDDCEGKADSHGCIDGVAALLEDLDPGVGCVVMDGHDHGVLSADWFTGLCRDLHGEQSSEEGGDGSGRMTDVQRLFSDDGCKNEDIVMT